MKGFKVLLRGLIKRHCNIEKDFRGPRLLLFGKESPKNNSKICLDMWGKSATKEYVLHWFLVLQATMGPTLVDHSRNLPIPNIHCHYFMENWPKKNNFVLWFMLMPNEIPMRGSRMRNLIFPLFKNWFLRATCVVIHDLPNLAKYVREAYVATTREKVTRTKIKIKNGGSEPMKTNLPLGNWEEPWEPQRTHW